MEGNIRDHEDLGPSSQHTAYGNKFLKVGMHIALQNFIWLLLQHD